jgi:exopolysaccharide production protein ExoQ
MPRALAQILCLAFIAWLWYRDYRNRPGLSPALWLPVLWLLVLGSRPLSFWFGISSPESDLEGNSFDRTIYFVEILASIGILSRRRLVWGQVIRENWPIFIFYSFLLASVLWADDSFVTFKRWFKDIGAIPVMLLILTDNDPFMALDAVFLRCAYVLLPLSVLFIKYIPELGRSYTPEGGVGYGGVTQQKNSLGEIVLVFSLFLVWRMFRLHDLTSGRWLGRQNWLTWMILAMGGWLLWISNSMTATLCLILGICILISYKLPLFRSNSRYVLIAFLIIIPGFLAANKAFDLADELLPLIGRNPTLTNRTDIWQSVMEHPVDPVFGCGYLMYWDLHRTIEIDGNPVTLKTAHNGYLEIYLDGGWLGIGFLVLMLLALGARASHAILTGTHYGRLQFAFFVVMLVYNMSESMYARRSPLWFCFLLFSLKASHLYVDEPEPDHELMGSAAPATA